MGSSDVRAAGTDGPTHDELFDRYAFEPADADLQRRAASRWTTVVEVRGQRSDGLGPQEGNCHEQHFSQGTEFGRVVLPGIGCGTEQPCERCVPDVSAAMRLMSGIRSHGLSRLLPEADREVGVVS